MGAEYERKFRADAACLEAIMADYPGDWVRTAMQTTYYDTPGRSLSEKRCTLRRRLENGVSVCTLKTPGAENTRGEWEVLEEHIEDALPELCKLDIPIDLSALCAEGIVPVCGAEFTRQSRLIVQSGFTAELALDQGFLFSGQKALPLCEVEVELKSGSPADMDAFAVNLAENYGLRPENASKFARALSLSQIP